MSSLNIKFKPTGITCVILFLLTLYAVIGILIYPGFSPAICSFIIFDSLLWFCLGKFSEENKIQKQKNQIKIELLTQLLDLDIIKLFPDIENTITQIKVKISDIDNPIIEKKDVIHY